jgi:hypothetical protein
MKRLLWVILGVSLVLAGCSQPLEGTGGRDTGAPPLRGITSFSLAGISGEIVGTTIYVRDVPLYTAEQTVTDLKNAVPVIGYTGGTLDPDPGLPRNFVTPVSYTLTMDDGATLNYTVVVTARPLISAVEIGTYLPLAAEVYAGTLEDPIPLPVSLVLSTTTWQGILSVIKSKAKYVALDLSACIAGTDTSGGGLYGDNTFDPGAANTGEDRIVSLVLPDAAEKIAAGTDASEAVFRNFIALKSVTAAGVTEVGDYAFSDSALTMVNLPAATTIGQYAFGACVSLTTVNLPAATTIDHNAFYDCVNLNEVSLLAAKTIGDDAFFACVSLENISLPAARTIGINAFASCAALETVNLPVATIIGQYAFNGCAVLREVYLPTAKTIDDSAFNNCTALSEVNLPTAVIIGDDAFAGCDTLYKVRLPLATNIGQYAFNDCDDLIEVDLPAVRTIGANAFNDCDKLREISLPKATIIGRSAFASCDILKTVSLPKGTTIGDSAFGNCALLEVNFPTATTIGTSAFANCAVLKTVSLPKATTIEATVFSGCVALETVSLPKAITLGQWAFANCIKLSEVDLSSVEEIGNKAFCLTEPGPSTSTLTVTLGALPPALSTSCFFNVNSTKNVIVKVPDISAYGTPLTVSSTDSNPCWANGFRGKGWEDNEFVAGGQLNGNIDLMITTL